MPEYHIDEVCRLILKHEDVAVNARDNEGRTALQICAAQGWQNVVQDLVNRKDVTESARACSY